MMILDTNVVSELIEERPNPTVMRWAESYRRDEFVVTAVNVMELRSGVENMPTGQRQREIADGIDWFLSIVLANRVLSFDRKAALAAATWFIDNRRIGRTLEFRDVQIAGIAISRRIPVATRNVAHFEGLAVKIIDPWSFSG